MSDDEILERALLSELSPEEEESLASRLKREPTLARRMLELSRDEALLADAVSEARAGRAVPKDSGVVPAGRAPTVAWIVALAAVTGLLVLAIPKTSSSTVLVTDLRGSVDLDDRDASLGDRGRVVQTGADGRAALQLPDGSRILLAGLTQFELEAVGRARLRTGVLEVLEGRIRLARGNGDLEIPAGRLASVAGGEPMLVDASPPMPTPGDFGSGRGLRGEYFDNEDLTNLKLTRIDPVVDFQWGLGSPHPSIDPETFSIRWRGQVEPLYSEGYTFHVVSDDGARLWVDGRPIVDDWTVRGTAERSGSIVLEAGHRYDVRLEYLQMVSVARVSLLWSSPSQKKEIVPARLLYPASSENHLIDEMFSSGAITPGVWTATLNGARFEPGYLHFPAAPVEKAPWLLSARSFDRKPGLCLTTSFLGSLKRGGAGDENPVVQFAASPRTEDRARAGPGWVLGQHLGPGLDTALPLLEKDGMTFFPVRNENVDTLFVTVLRRRGAFYLTCGEPSSSPPRAKLQYVSHTGEAPAVHVSVTGGQADARFASLTLTDLGGAWAEPYGLATLTRPAIVAGELLEASVDGQWEVTATPAPGTTSVALLVRAKDERNHYRFELMPTGSRLVLRRDGRDISLPDSEWRGVKLLPGVSHRLAVRMEGKEVRLYVDDVMASYGRVPAVAEELGARIGVASEGSAVFTDLVEWPTTVELPEALAAKIPPVPLRAEGSVLLREDFKAPDNLALEGRTLAGARRPWAVAGGAWTIDHGAAVATKAPAQALVPCGQNDYEVTALLELPPAAPPPGNSWIAGLRARAPGPPSPGSSDGIEARIVWQGATGQIEVWDRPASTPENVRKWGEAGGDSSGRIHARLVLATDLTPLLATGRVHALRLVVRGTRLSCFCDETLAGTGTTRCASGSWVGLSAADVGESGARVLGFSARAFRNR